MAKALSAKAIAKEVIKEAKSQVEQENKPAGLQGAMREKYWKELTDTEKIERMRTMVKKLQDEIKDEINRFQGTFYKLNRHEHDEKGEVIIKERLRYGVGVEVSRPPGRLNEGDEVYF